MWLITQFGFFSIVQKPGQRATGTLTVRGRVRADLDNLRSRYLPAMGPVEADSGTDYKYRAIVSAKDVARAIRQAVADIDYANFKNSVYSEQGAVRSSLYHELWGTLWKLDGADDARLPATTSGLPGPAASAPHPDTDDEHAVGNRFVDTEQDLPCWGIPAPDHVANPAETSTDGSNNSHLEERAVDRSTMATAFGGVVFDNSGRILLRRPAGEFDGYVWTFPKGAPEHREQAKTAAIREVREETGVQATIICQIPGVFHGGTSATAYYRMSPLKNHDDFDRAETERVTWAEPAEARRLIAQTRNAVGRQRDLDVLAAALGSFVQPTRAADEAIAQLPSELMSRSGALFYSGRGAFERPNGVYLLGLNPGGSPTKLADQTIAHDCDEWRRRPSAWSAYTDESWAGKPVGQSRMQLRIDHMFRSLGRDLRTVPSSNVVFVRTRSESELRTEKATLLSQCWPVHDKIIHELAIRTILCLGRTAGRWCRDAVGATQLVDTFRERNDRGWQSRAHLAPDGRAVVTLSHPSWANWRNPSADPTPLVRRVLER